MMKKINVDTFLYITRISRIATGIRLIRIPEVAVGYPIISGDEKNPTRPEHRVPEFIGYPHTPNIFSNFFLTYSMNYFIRTFGI